MKKILALLLSAILLLSLAACGGNSATTGTTQPTTTPPTGTGTTTNPTGTTAELEMSEIPPEQYTIAIAFNSADETTEAIKRYLTDEFAQSLNLRFIFSEQILDAEMLLTFMENAFSAGADAVLNTLPNAHEAAAVKAEELGIYILTMGSTYFPNVETLSRNLGVIGVSVTQQAEAFGNVTRRIIEDEQPPNIIIISGGSGIGVRSHFETTKAILDMMKKQYNLTYSQSIEDLAKVTAITEVSTGTDMKIVVYPGFGGPTYVSDFSSLLQTGDYDVVLSTYAAFRTLSVAIDEVEKAFGMDIRQIAVTSVNEVTSTAFNTLDSQGSPILNAAVINPSTVAFGMSIALLYNAVSGHSDIVRPEGKSSQLFVTPWEVNGLDDYAELARLDQSHETYTLNSNDIKGLLYVYNPAVQFEDFAETLASLTAENLIDTKLN